MSDSQHRTDGPAGSAEKSERRPPLIPPHIAWPGVVVLLLGATVLSMTGVLMAANSDGGVAVVEDYYRQGLDYDAVQKAQQASAALGWTAEAVLDTPTANGLQPLAVTVRDRRGAPVTGLVGIVRARRADEAEAAATVPLAETEAPGVYRQALPLGRGGVWDFELDARRGEARFVTTIRRTL
ncbi:MAG: FixH family protein [Rhodothermales bacterium]|nr:FixH family protein [Rhodothermales bacterium]